MSGNTHSTYDVRLRAVRAVLVEEFTVTDVAQAYGTDRTTVHRWIARFQKDRDTGLARKPGNGRPRKLGALDSGALRDVVLSPASNYGYETDFWTTRRLIQVIHSKVVPKIRQAVEKYRAILYFQDEANVSLTALLAKTWAPRGQTPKQRVTGKRASVSAMSAITARGRLIFRLLDKRIASPEVIEFLKQMLKHHRHRHLVVVMDQAPPHTSKQTATYIASEPRLHVFHLPAYSPDWNPDEKVWNHLKHQELKGHQARTKEELSTLTKTKLTMMSKDPELLRGIFFRCCIADILL